MDVLSNLELGFAVALTAQNILYCFIGVFLGTVVGVLPGIGPVTTVAMLLPISFTLEPVSAMIMLAGIYYGAQYGGSTTAILVNIPGEVTAIVTTLDGHQMARQGRAGVALGIAAIGSFFAGCVATIVIAALAAPLVKLALLFGSAEYFSLMVLGLAFAVVLAMTKNPTLFWGMIASMWVGNLMLLVINLPLVGIWVKLLDVPYRLMYPAILVFSCIGIYSVNNSPSDVLLTGVFALVGYALLKLGFETAPLLLGY